MIRILLSGSQGSRYNYEEAIRRAGGEALSYHCPPLDAVADALLLCGGGDIAPAHLGCPDQGSRDLDWKRDEVEFALLRRFLAEEKPVFGICRGHQVMNVALGGTLLQDVGRVEAFHSPVPHGGNKDVHHTIVMESKGILNSLYGSIAVVNSWHHQAITKAGRGMRVTAISEGGLIEATEHEHMPVFSVQFHPERLDGADRLLAQGDLLFRHFLSLIRR